MAAALVYRPTIIKTVCSQFKLKRIQGGWYKLCEASGVRSKQGSKEARKQGSKEARKQGKVISAERYFERPLFYQTDHIAELLIFTHLDGLYPFHYRLCDLKKP